MWSACRASNYECGIWCNYNIKLADGTLHHEKVKDDLDKQETRSGDWTVCANKRFCSYPCGWWELRENVNFGFFSFGTYCSDLLVVNKMKEGNGWENSKTK